MDLFTFLGTDAGADLLRIVGNIVSIIGAILTGAALRNLSQVKKMIGGVVRPSLMLRIFRRARHGSDVATDAKPDAFQSLTIAQKVDMLKENQDLISLRQGVDSQDIRDRLDRVDPPTRRH